MQISESQIQLNQLNLPHEISAILSEDQIGNQCYFLKLEVNHHRLKGSLHGSLKNDDKRNVPKTSDHIYSFDEKSAPVS